MSTIRFAGPAAAVLRAVSDPGSILPRLSGEWGVEPLPEWQARAVLRVGGPAVGSDREAIDAGDDGILRGWAVYDGERDRIWRVIVGGRHVSVWTKRRWARRELRAHLRRRTRYSIAELSDLSRGDIDPDWPRSRGTMPGPDEGASP